MSNEFLKEVLSCPSLPSLPEVAVRLLELTSDPDVAMSDISQLVQQDQALAAKVLKTVNSSFYGLTTPCGSIDRAMGYLGLNTVKSLVLGFSLVETTRAAGGEQFDITSHWRRAIIGATGSRAIAACVGEADADEAFTAALFQDMGMLAIFAAKETDYLEMIRGLPHHDICVAEKEAFGFDHAMAGAELAGKWKLPADICEAIRFHHNPNFAGEKHKQLARVVSIGSIITDAMNEETARSAINRLERMTYEWFGKAAPDVRGLIEEVAETSRTLAKMFNQEIGEIPNAADLMARAQEKGIEHQLTIQREAEALAREAQLDGLTRIANRKSFDTELDRVFDAFKARGESYGVLFFDADKFKTVNDTHGHAAGDEVLRELSKRTSGVVGERGLVCRYGGEEFAVIVQGATLDECAALGEDIRAKIAQTPFDLSMIEGVPDELAVTVSIGVSSTEAGDQARLASADHIVHEADECVYAAKAAGRNRLMVWGRHEDPAQASKAATEPVVVVAAEQPAAPTPAGADTPASAPVSETGSGASPKIAPKAPSIGRILLVEDDSLAATLVISLIKRRCKVEIQWVKSGTKACVLLESGRYVGDESLNLILCDFSLPGCNGHEVLRLAKHTPSVAGVPFIMLTGNTDRSMMDESHRLGVTRFIRKDEFCKDVNRWLGELLVSSNLAA